MRILSLLAALLLTVATVIAAEPVDTRQGPIAPGFKSLTVSLESDLMADPVITLGSGERILVSFDELAMDRRYMRYSLTHCDSRWQPEDLVDSEFLDSFNEGEVEDYAFSRATLVHYVNYRITIPNDQVRITQPGNYLLRVWDEQEPDSTLLQARFCVVDPAVDIAATVSSRTDIDVNHSHQQLALALSPRALPIADPFNDIKVVITQNGRPDSEVHLQAPQRLEGNRLIYEHMPALIFPAGNEYRRFETVTDNYPGIGIDHIDRSGELFEAYLQLDQPRTDEPYQYDETQHGRFLVRASGVSDSSTEADYMLTHFSLTLPTFPQGLVYLDGNLTDRRFSPEALMDYNPSTGLNEKTLLLKQGSYNYQYLLLTPGDTSASTAPIEGDNYQTSNEYTIRVYHRPRGSRMDRLVGVTTITSNGRNY